MNLLLVMAAAGAIAAAETEPEKTEKDTFRVQIEQTSGDKTTRMLKERAAVSETKARMIGKFVADKFKEKRVAVLLAGAADTPWNEKILKSYRDAAGNDVIIEIVSVKMPENALPLPDDEPGVEAMNASLLECIERRADAVVNFAGLPFRDSQCKKLIFWNWTEDDPKVILADLSDPLMLKRMYFPRPLAAAVVSVPERNEFVFITNENADGIIKSRQLILSN